MLTRRHFLTTTLAGTTGWIAAPLGIRAQAPTLRPQGENINFGLCTYMWGAQWDVPTLIENLTTMNMKGVELRVEHAHGVAPTLSTDERDDIRSQFNEAGITVVGLGTNAQFDSPDEAKLKENIQLAKDYIKLSHDVGGSGVKVKPDKLHEKAGVPKEKTLEQIGKALAELGEYSLGFGQEIRLEVHGDVNQGADIRTIMEIAKSDNVRVCWNCNGTDISNGSINENFTAVKDYLGRTLHVHEQENTKYPYDALAKHLVDQDYDGWVLLEAASKVDDPIGAILKHWGIWTQHVKTARASA